MACDRIHQLPDLFFREGEDKRLAELSEHAAHCHECRMFLSSMKRTMGMLSALAEEEPPPQVLDRILTEVSASHPKPAAVQTGVRLVPVLQIAFGEIFLFALMYFIKIQISFSWLEDWIMRYPVIRSIGSMGVSVIIVLLAGSFVTLALAPILLMESNKKFSG